ncbi:DUF3152 domain-containing protein [Jatrophihabitans sp.]|uniref:DUF3152 domain-containing protein n=1 Tax=Jatrophihabitans sp. TaxID=1932789 RepID=UPI002B77C8AA|nr:DUF3152 domain-containing protein [Jatrophihabitans sp.]
MHRQPIRALAAALLCAAGCLLGFSQPSAAATAAPQIVYTYEVRGLANSSSLESFAAAAASTYADPRGWNLGGSIAFRRVASGGNFTLWLAAASRVPGFGSPCDSTYSCRVGRNVIINETRWLNASPSWNAYGASLASYRNLVVNHETGHWLGFGHAFCGGSGQLAPVMQQQSISLQGCRPNAWPTASERQRLAASRGVPIRTGNPVGSLDNVVPQLAAVFIRGWAIDPDTSGPTSVTVQLDSKVITVRADSLREDVGRTHPGYGNNHGYRLTLNASPGRHTVCVRALNAAGAGATVLLGCRTVAVSGTPIGHLDSVVPSGQGILVTGWALDPDTSTGAVPVAVYEQPGGQVGIWANQPRSDIATRYPRWGSAHGFAVLMRATPGVHQVCAYARNIYGIGSTATLGCRSVSVPG